MVMARRDYALPCHCCDNGVRWPPRQGAYPICVKCDRAKCGNPSCRAPIVDPHASRCMTCGLALRPMPRPD